MRVLGGHRRHRALGTGVGIALMGGLLATGSPVPSQPPASSEPVATSPTPEPSSADPTPGVSGPGPVGRSVVAARPLPRPSPTVSFSPDDFQPSPVPETVRVLSPDLHVRPAEDGQLGAVTEAVSRPEIAGFAGLATVEAEVPTRDGTTTLTVAGVDPTAFRPLTPEVTAQSRGVWQRLSEGDVAVRHDVAHQLDLELGGSFTLRGPEADVSARVGAFASNGTPPVADVVAPSKVASALGAGPVDLLVVALTEDADAEETGDAIVERLGGGEATVLSQPEEHTASLRGGAAVKRFEPFSYLDLGDGMIVIDDHWVQHWIVTVDLPHLGRARCHRLMVPQLVAALREIADRDLAHLLDPDQFAGCWVPRHIDWDPDKPLSMHAWGLAVDINAADNPLGTRPTLDPRIVEIFEKWGFRWGGRWARPDGMHFELRALVDTGS